jgi:hypothetical protein
MDFRWLLWLQDERRAPFWSSFDPISALASIQVKQPEQPIRGLEYVFPLPI